MRAGLANAGEHELGHKTLVLRLGVGAAVGSEIVVFAVEFHERLAGSLMEAIARRPGGEFWHDVLLFATDAKVVRTTLDFRKKAALPNAGR